MTNTQASESEDTEKDAKGNPLDLGNYFLVVGRKWDIKSGDHVEVIGGKQESSRFSELEDAMEQYDKLKYDDFPEGGGNDVRLDLLHSRFGISHIVKTRILFP